MARLLGADRVRGPRPRPQDRRQGHRGRSQPAEKGGYRGSSLSCPNCHRGGPLRGLSPQGHAQPARAHPTSSGPTTIASLAVAGHCPGDEVAGPDRRRPDARAPPRRSASAGTLGGFAKAAEKILLRAGGVEGLRVHGPAAPPRRRAGDWADAWTGARPSDRPGTGPGTRTPRGRPARTSRSTPPSVPQQGPKAAKADGRMATVAMIYNPIPDDRSRWAGPARRRPPWQAPLRGQPGRPGRAGRAVASARRPRSAWTAPTAGSRSRDGGCRAGGLAAGALRPGRGGDPRLLPRLGAPRRPGQGLARGGRPRPPRRSIDNGRIG